MLEFSANFTLNKASILAHLPIRFVVSMDNKLYLSLMFFMVSLLEPLEPAYAKCRNMITLFQIKCLFDNGLLFVGTVKKTGRK